MIICIRPCLEYRNSFISKLSLFYPLGPLLDVIGVDKSQLHFHCTYVLQQAVCKVLKKVCRSLHFIYDNVISCWLIPNKARQITWEGGLGGGGLGEGG